MAKKKIQEPKQYEQPYLKELVPQPISDLDIAFPANVLHLMPRMEDIPVEFTHSSNRWVKFQQDWFFRGLKSLKIEGNPDVNTTSAMRHLRCIQGSFQPTHEHKEAAVAYLCSLWFKDIEYEAGK